VLSTLAEIEELYSSNLLKHGPTPKSVGWNTSECQNLRFEKLLGLFDFKEPFNLTELGCGYGSLIEFMKNKKLEFSEYIGIDISEGMLDQAHKLYGRCDNIKLLKGSEITEATDYSVTSGIFNVKFDASEQEWTEYILNTLNKMHDFSRKGFSFNLPTSYVDYKKDNLYYGDPLFFFDYCKKKFSPYVALTHDYPLWEWSITVKK